MAIAVNWISYGNETGDTVNIPDLPFADLGAFTASSSADGVTRLEKKFYFGLKFQGTSVTNIRVWLDGVQIDAYAPEISNDPLLLRTSLSNLGISVKGIVVAPVAQGDTDPVTLSVSTWYDMPTDEGVGLALGDAYLGSSFNAYSAIFALGVVAGPCPNGPSGTPVNIDLCNFRLLASFDTTDDTSA